MRRKRMRRKQCVVLLAASLGWQACFVHTVFAAENVYHLSEETQENEIYTAADGNQIEDAQLNDTVIEYDELGSLIHTYNTSIREMTDSTERSRNDYKAMQEELRVAEGDAEWSRDEAEDEGDMETYAEEVSNRMVYQSAIRSYNDMIDSLDDYSSTKSQRNQEKQLTNSAQSLMISYQSLINEKEYTEKTLELYQAQYGDAQTRLSAGLGTAQEVMSAYTSQLSAELSLASLDADIASVYQSLCHLLGVDENGSMSVAEVPAPDLEKISQMDLTADTASAISNNLDIISERDSSTDGSTTDGERKNRTIDELKSQVTIEMQNLYQEVLDANISFDAARTGLDSARITWENAQKKYSMGMLSRTDYLQEQSSYIQKEFAFQTAELSLFQAMENYYWGVNSVMTLS